MTDLIIAAAFLAFLGFALGVGGLVLDAYERYQYRRAIERRAAHYRGHHEGATAMIALRNAWARLRHPRAYSWYRLAPCGHRAAWGCCCDS